MVEGKNARGIFFLRDETRRRLLPFHEPKGGSGCPPPLLNARTHGGERSNGSTVEKTLYAGGISEVSVFLRSFRSWRQKVEGTKFCSSEASFSSSTIDRASISNVWSTFEVYFLDESEASSKRIYSFCTFG